MNNIENLETNQANTGQRWKLKIVLIIVFIIIIICAIFIVLYNQKRKYVEIPSPLDISKNVVNINKDAVIENVSDELVSDLIIGIQKQNNLLKKSVKESTE